jgi:hypothetical protein
MWYSSQQISTVLKRMLFSHLFQPYTLRPITSNNETNLQIGYISYIFKVDSTRSKIYNYFTTIFTSNILDTYEARTLLGLDVSRCRTRVRVGHRHNTDTYNYIELCHFFKLLSVSTCQCPCRVRCPCLCPCFIVRHCIHMKMRDAKIHRNYSVNEY